MPSHPPSLLRRHAARLLALLLCGLLYGLTRGTHPSAADRATLAAKFAFVGRPLPLPPGAGAPRTVRKVHPALARFDAWIATVGAAVALNDLDGDGLPNDLCHVDPRFDTVLVAPAPGTGARFTPRTLDPSPLPYDASTMAPMGVLVGDFDEDGGVDVLVYYWGRTPVLFCDPLGTPRAHELVAGGERWYTNAATSADLDGDGHLDLVFGNYFADGTRVLDAHATDLVEMQDSMSRAENGGSKQLLLFTPGGRFERRNDALPENVRHGWSLALAAADLDGDLLPELYLANDFGHDRLLHNRSTPGAPRLVLVEGRRGFTDPASCVLGNDSFKGMGVDFGDLNGDGHPDLYVSNISTEFGLMESQLCFVSTGELSAFAAGVAPYHERAEALGLSRSGWGWDCRLADFDNDGDVEVVQAAGFVRGTTNRWPELHELAMGNDQLLRHPGAWPNFMPGDDLSGDRGLFFFTRGGDGKFVELSAELGFTGEGADKPHVTRGIAIADIDGDGALEFALAGQWEGSWLWHNRRPQRGDALVLRLLLPLHDEIGTTRVLEGTAAPALTVRAAVGAHAKVTRADGVILSGEVLGGGGHSGGRAPELHFGLGTSGPAPVTIDLRWRDREGRARRDRLTLPPGRHTVVLGAGQE